MFTASQLEAWLWTMGYDGELPKSFQQKICGPSTSNIWDQLITKVKPKQDVDHCRKNIIIKRLKDKPLDQQREHSYPIEEIDIYLKKKELLKKKERLEETVKEKDAALEELIKKNKKTFFVINHKKEKIKEIYERIHLLNKKCEMLEKDKNHVQEMLALAKNLTPVERDLSDSTSVQEVLEKCAKKLEKIVKDSAIQDNVIKSHQMKSVLTNSTIFKTPKPQGSIKKYFNESANLTTLGILSRRRIHFKLETTVGRNDNSIVEENIQNKYKNRESLGLLPNECLDSYDEFDDMFLMPGDFLSKSKKNHSSVISGQNSEDIDLLEKLNNCVFVKELLENLLHSNNRQIIFEHFQEITKQLMFQVKNLLLDSNTFSNVEAVAKKDLVALYHIHVKNELETVKYRTLVQKMLVNIKIRKEEVYTSLISSCASKSELEIKRIFDLQIEEAILNANCAFLKKIINQEQYTNKENELQNTAAAIDKAQTEITCKSNSIKANIDNIFRVIQQIKDNREEAAQCVKRLGNFIIERSWAQPLLEDVISNELGIFQDFPLAYNSERSREVLHTAIQSFVKMDSGNFDMIATLIDAPFMPSESILIQMLHDKIKLTTLKAITESCSTTLDCAKYSMESLKAAEKSNNVLCIVKELRSLLASPDVHKILSCPDRMSHVVQLWHDLFVKNYISDHRLVDGHTFKFYEDTFLNLVS